MAFSSKANSMRAPQSPDASRPFAEWDNQEKQPRDWKKVALIFGLGSLSWVATYVGMLELIQANMGDLPLLQKAIIGFAVAMLMLMIIWLLDQLFAPHNFITKLSYVGGYLFLTLISIGFGFGFYWKVLESRSESTRSAESAISQVQTSLHGASTRLAQLQTTLEGLAIISSRKAIEERDKGTSCPNSSPGDGPRRRLRDEDAARFGFSSQFVKSRIGTVNKNMGALNGDLQKVVKGARSTFDAKTGTRNEFMRQLNRKLNLTVTGFNAFRTDPQLLQIRQNLAERAGRTSFPNGKGGSFSCPDTQLQTALRGVVRAIDQLPELQKPKIAAVEGSEAVIEAFRRLSATLFGALQFKLPPSPEDLRALQQRAVQSMKSTSRNPAAVSMDGAGLAKRDYIPLAIALFVDLCLLLVSIGRPMNRLDNLIPKMRRAERGPVIGILTRFNEIHKDKEMRENFEIFRHVVFDWGGHYYVAVPMNAPYTANIHLGGGQYERINNEVGDLQTEAHLLANLFSSFEQEKIFSRVLVPLLSTKAIQKKLHAQGSKFAGSQSFRVYKFRDGAWSEIILGAVMGAARRVESKKHRQALEADAADVAPPAFETTHGVMPGVTNHGAATYNDAADARPLTPQDAVHAMGQFGAKVSDHSFNRTADAAVMPGPGPGNMATPPPAPASVDLDAVAHATRPATANGNAIYWDDNTAPSPSGTGPSAPGSADVNGFGPYGSAAAAEFAQAPGDRTTSGNNNNGPAFAANNNTSPCLSPYATPLRPAMAPIQQPAAPAASSVINIEPVPASMPANEPVGLAGNDTRVDSANVIHLPNAQQTTQPASLLARENWSGALTDSLSLTENTALPIQDVAIDENSANFDVASVIEMPAPEAGRVNVELRERTVTYSIPAQDAALPQSLLAPSLLGSATVQLSEKPGGAALSERLALAEPEPVQVAAVEIEQTQGVPEPVEYIIDEPAERLTESADLPTPSAGSDIEPQDAILEADDFAMGWGEEAVVEINTSEISRRFAHGSKTD